MSAGRSLWVVGVAALALLGPDTVAAADPMAGRALFIGARPLAGGGPPCGGCHAVGGASAPFAANMGPELSRSFEGMDAAGVDALLRELEAFPTMTPLYAGRALAEPERADLGAFMLQASGKPAPTGGAVAGYAAAMAALVLLALSRVSRRTKGSTRAALLALARERSQGAPRARTPPPPRPAPEPPPAGGFAPSPATPRPHGDLP